MLRRRISSPTIAITSVLTGSNWMRKSLRPAELVAQHRPHHAAALRAVRRPQMMPQLVDQELELLCLADFGRPFAREDVRVQRPARAGHVSAAAGPSAIGS